MNIDTSSVQSESSISRVDLEVLQLKDKIEDFLEFMNKKADKTKTEVLNRKAIEYWKWSEPIAVELLSPDRKIKPLVIYNDKTLWGTASFWERKQTAERVSEEEEEEDEEDDYDRDNPSKNAFMNMNFYKYEERWLERKTPQLEKIVRHDGDGYDVDETEEDEEEEGEEEEEEEEEEGDEYKYIDDYIYCYKSCHTCPDGYVANSCIRKTCFHGDNRRRHLEEQLKDKFTVYMRKLKSVATTTTKSPSKPASNFSQALSETVAKSSAPQAD